MVFGFPAPGSRVVSGVQLNVSDRAAAALRAGLGTIGIELARPGTATEVAAWVQSLLPVMLA
jgi:hypothetical protein